MTLSEFKRTVKKGDALTMTHNATAPNNKLIGVKRYVVGVQTNGITLNTNKEAVRGSFLEFPPASLFECDGETFKIFSAGIREMNAEEKRVYENMPSKRAENAERVELDALTDGSAMFWLDRSYLKEAGMEYLEGSKEARGKYKNSDEMIRDNSVKGEVELIYRLGD